MKHIDKLMNKIVEKMGRLGAIFRKAKEEHKVTIY